MGIVELTENVAAKLDITKVAARAAVDAVLDSVQTLTNAGETIAIRGFGTFKNKTTAARTGRNPATGEEIAIPEKTKLTFKAAK